MENLYAEFLLWYHGFTTKETYEALLNESFLNSTNNILLELEEISSDLLDTRGRFMRYWDYECPTFDSDTFGKRLFSGLERVYKSNNFSIDDFGKKCNLLWKDLPSGLEQTEPFWTLIYADDCLSWGDETQTRKLYEKVFAFYA